MPTPLVGCTALGVCAAGLSASFVESQNTGMLIMLAGLTLGPFAGLVVDTFMTQDRRTQSFIGRRYARTFRCPECGNEFASIQRIGQCPRCDTRFTASE